MLFGVFLRHLYLIACVEKSDRMADAGREAIKALIAETLALRVANELEFHTLPDEVEMGKFRPLVAAETENVLANFERQLAVSTISDAVVDRLRGDLVRRSRVSGIIEIGINVAALILGIVGGSIVAISDPATHAAEVRGLAIAVCVIVLLQFVGNLYLRYFDHAR